MSNFNLHSPIQQVLTLAKLGIDYINAKPAHANANAVYQIVSIALAEIALQNKDRKLARKLLDAADVFVTRAQELEKQGIKGDISPPSLIARVAAVFVLDVDQAEFLVNKFFAGIDEAGAI
jgi:hypothetical protein